MALPATDLASLVRYLADKYHGGSVYPMTDRTGLSNATLNKWVHGRVASPDLVSLFKLADGYGEDRAEVLAVAFKRPLVSRRRQRGKKLLGFLLAASLSALAGPAPATPSGDVSLDSLDLIGRRRRLPRWLMGLTPLVTRRDGVALGLRVNWLGVRTDHALA